MRPKSIIMMSNLLLRENKMKPDFGSRLRAFLQPLVDNNFLSDVCPRQAAPVKFHLIDNTT